jgi:hypothetical protein
MKTYKIRFKGVTVGSIGKKRLFIESIQSDSFKNAWLKLYDKYEHISIETVNGKKYNPIEKDSYYD